MIDYSEIIIGLHTGRRKLSDLLTKRKFDLALKVVDDLIVSLIDLKWWIKKQNESQSN